MGRKWVPKWAELDDEGCDGFVERGISIGIKGESRQKYRGAYARFIDFLVRKKYAFDLRALGRFLWACRRQGASGSTLEGYRSAILWTQRCHGLDVFAGGALLIRAVKGFKYQDRLLRKPRGAITTGMLKQLAALDPAYATGYATIFYCVLRKGQFLKLRNGDAQVTDEMEMFVTLRRDKRMNRDSVREVITNKEVVHPAGKALLLSASNGEHGTLMFPGFDTERANTKIREAAIVFGWPAELDFDGIHCLRHGGSQVVKAFIARLVARLGDPCAMSAPTQALYMRLNELRVRIDNDSGSDGDADDG